MAGLDDIVPSHFPSSADLRNPRPNVHAESYVKQIILRAHSKQASRMRITLDCKVRNKTRQV